MDYEVFELGNWTLQSGLVIPNARLAYKTFGDTSLPAVIYPTWYSAGKTQRGLEVMLARNDPATGISDNTSLVGENQALNPNEYFIIIPALFGNGESSSPSNTLEMKNFPDCTFYDNVRAQHKLVTEKLRVRHAFAVLGWSMGASQVYQWITQYPDFVDLAVAFCGAAKTSIHCQVALDGLRAILLSANFQKRQGGDRDGFLSQAEDKVRFDEEASRMVKAFGRAMGGWAFGKGFFDERLFKSVLGFESLNNSMVEFWEAWAISKDPAKLLAMLSTWRSGDCSMQDPYNGDFKNAMQAISAKVLVLPVEGDLFFPPEDSKKETLLMRGSTGKVEVIHSKWGHWAGGPGDSKYDFRFLNIQISAFFATG